MQRIGPLFFRSNYLFIYLFILFTPPLFFLHQNMRKKKGDATNPTYLGFFLGLIRFGSVPMMKMILLYLRLPISGHICPSNEVRSTKWDLTRPDMTRLDLTWDYIYSVIISLKKLWYIYILVFFNKKIIY
jgi:hypothetical protein